MNNTLQHANDVYVEAQKQLDEITQPTTLQQELLANGYKKHVGLHYLSWKSTDTLFQKCVRDDLGKRYYIDVWYYPEKDWHNGITTPESIQVEVQFRDQDGEPCLNVSPIVNNDFIKAEDIIEGIWVSEGCGYYERREDY